MTHTRPTARVLFIGPAPLASLAAICFEALAPRLKATAAFSHRRGKPEANPLVTAMIEEMGGARWQAMERKLDAGLIEAVDLVVTISRTRRPASPKLPGVPRRHEHWSVPERTHEPPRARARSLRDGLRARVAMLVFMEGWGRPEMSREAARLTRPPAIEGHHPLIPLHPFRVDSPLSLRR